MAENKVTLPVAFTTYQYSKSRGKRIPVGVIIVTKDDVKAYGRNDSLVGSFVNTYAERSDDETEADRQNFATNYRDSAASGGGYGITTEMVRYGGEDRVRVDADLNAIINANTDSILGTKKPKKASE